MPTMLSALTLLMATATPVLAQVPAVYEQSSDGSIGVVAPVDPADAVEGLSKGVLSVRAHSQDLAVTSQNRQRDSLLNGVLVGAGIGAMLGLAFGVSQEDACGGCAGFNQPLAYGAIVGGVGAAVGAGIDALFHRAVPAVPRAHNIRVQPMLSRDIRGLSGSVRF